MKMKIILCLLVCIAACLTLEAFFNRLPFERVYVPYVVVWGVFPVISFCCNLLKRRSGKVIARDILGSIILAVFIISAMELSYFIVTLCDRSDDDVLFMCGVFLACLYVVGIYTIAMYLYIKHFSGWKEDIEAMRKD